MRGRGVLVTVLMSLAWQVAAAKHAPGPLILRENFSDPAWRESWSEEKLSSNRNSYEVIAVDENQVLRVQSTDAAGGLWRRAEIKPVQSGTVSWRWKIDGSLTENRRERERRGDDYAARFKVVFEDRFPIWNTRVISYVWAGREREGATYKSPYCRNVATVVLRSGNEEAGTWVQEERDLVADYVAFFGRPPAEISGLALMVDTDNTNGRATACFDDIALEAD